VDIPMTTAIQVTLPEELVSEARRFIGEGWAGDLNELFAVALRRYLESHGPALTEEFIRDDVAWGLHGRT
jgi:metal-responsive CopG/Arc/MetJ family transcriptional regulator